MNQRGFSIPFLMTILAITLVGTASYFAVQNISKPSNQPANSNASGNGNGSLQYSATPSFECEECFNGRSLSNRLCCDAAFSQRCTDENGVLRKSDLHPATPVFVQGCFQQAPDAGKKCAAVTECLSGVCDLKSAVETGSCTLTKKEYDGREIFGQKTYTATYTCTTTAPGTCAATPDDKLNPGGISHIWQMKNSTLIETVGSGPIY